MRRGRSLAELCGLRDLQTLYWIGKYIHRVRDPELNASVPGFIPDDYVPDVGQRLDLYKRLSGAADQDEVNALLEEMVDRYGPLPSEVSILADLMVIKALARRLRAASVELTPTRLTLALGDDTPLRPDKVLALVKAPRSAYRLTADMRLSRALSAAEAKAPAEAAKATLLELLGCVDSPPPRTSP